MPNNRHTRAKPTSSTLQLLCGFFGSAAYSPPDVAKVTSFHYLLAAYSDPFSSRDKYKALVVLVRADFAEQDRWFRIFRTQTHPPSLWLCAYRTEKDYRVGAGRCNPSSRCFVSVAWLVDKTTQQGKREAFSGFSACATCLIPRATSDELFGASAVCRWRPPVQWEAKNFHPVICDR